MILRYDRDDGRTEFVGAWEGQTILVVTEGTERDGLQTVVNVIVERPWRR